MDLVTQLAGLPIPQLLKLKNDLETQVSYFQAAFDELQSAKSRFEVSLQALKKISTADDDTVLVPLTQSIYQRGELIDKKKYVLDIGAGYFIEQSGVKCEQYFERRISLLQEQIEKTETELNLKKRFLGIIGVTVQHQVSQQQQANPQTA